jgi:hypothetical protein
VKARALWQVYALRLTRNKRSAEEAPAKVVEVVLERHLVGNIKVTKETLVLVVSARRNAAPRYLEIGRRGELLELHA